MGIKDTKMFHKFARKAFDEIDMDKTGRVDYKEVRMACRCR
jgi:Ca2+-binding EF-hand superfamily protein